MPTVETPKPLAAAALALHLEFGLFLRLHLGDLLLPLVEEEVLPLPKATCREGAHVALDATPQHVLPIRLEVWVLMPRTAIPAAVALRPPRHFSCVMRAEKRSQRMPPVPVPPQSR